MPTFEVDANGKTYELDAPDMASATAALKSLPPGFQIERPNLSSMSDADLTALYRQQSGNGTPPLPDGFQLEQPNMAADVAKSTGIGAAKGAIGLAGFLGDTSEYGARGIDVATRYIGNKLGYDIPERPNQDFSGGSAQIQRGIEGVTGPFYEPQTQAGKYAETAGAFLPTAFMGPGGVTRQILTNVVAPTVGTELAGAMTKGTAAEPYARAAGGLIGNLGASRIGASMDDAAQAAKVSSALPNVDELKQASRDLYKSPEVTDVRIAPQAVSDLRDRIVTDLRAQGFRPANQGAVFSTVDELAPGPAAAGALPPPGSNISVAQYRAMQAAQQSLATVADLDSARKALTQLAKEKDVAGAATPAAAAASIAIGHISDFLPNLSQKFLLAGDAQKANAALNEARGNWGAAKRAELVATKLGNADLMAASTYGGGNINNAMRQQFRPLLMNNAAKAGGYSDQALADLNQVVRGTPTGNLMRSVGKLAPSGPVGMGLHIGAAYGSGGASLAALPVTVAAKYAGQRMTRNAVNQLSETLRADSPLARLTTPQGMASLQQSDNPVAAALLRAIIASRTGQQPQP